MSAIETGSSYLQINRKKEPAFSYIDRAVDASSICTIQRMDTGQSHSICITLFLRDKIKRLHRNNTILQKEMIFCLASTGEKAIFVAVIIK